MREIDRLAIDEFKVPSLTLMENAGRKVAEAVELHAGKGGPILVVCGKGNNGGDGLVAARHLSMAGFPVEVALTDAPEAFSKDAGVNWERIKGTGIKYFLIEGDAGFLRFRAAIHDARYIIDAIFGTGLASEVKGKYQKIIEMLNAGSRPVISVDIPSGLSADTGGVLGAAVRARLTITFGLPKAGHVLPPGPDYVRELRVVDIGFPSMLIDSFKSDMNLITPSLFKKYFQPRRADAHKGDFGHVLVLAGATGKMGAGWLASKSALRSGAGLVTYALPSAAFAKFDARFAEVMVEPVDDKKRGRFTVDSIDDIKRLCQGKDAAAFGPGIGVHKDTEDAAVNIAAKLSLPLVIDADGLNNLVNHLGIFPKRRHPTVLTPHPGEMARLAKTDAKTVAKERVKIAKNFAAAHGVHLVLKGGRTVVATPEGAIYINPTGGPGMATAGTGDALTGMIAAFLARGIPAGDAVISAVYIHGLAGDLAASKAGEIGMIASDLIENIPEAIRLIGSWEEREKII